MFSKSGECIMSLGRLDQYMNIVQLEEGERVIGVNAVLFSEGHKWCG